MQDLLTSEKINELTILLQDLENEEIRLARRVRQLLKENGEELDSFEYEHIIFRLRYEIPRKRRDIVEKISALKKVAKEDKKFDGQTVSVGTKITLDYDGEEETFVISPVYESDLRKGVVSCDAPIVQCILGKRKGDIVIFNEYEVKIVKVEKI